MGLSSDLTPLFRISPDADATIGCPMTRYLSKSRAALVALGFASLATPLSAMTPAQCDAMLMAGPQAYSSEAVASCMPYFQTLARNAAGPGVFSASPGSVTVATSGTGG